MRRTTPTGPGKRYLVSSLPRGALIWLGEWQPGTGGWSPLLVGRAGTELYRLGADALEQLAEPGELAAQLEALVDAVGDADGREKSLPREADGGSRGEADRLQAARQRLGELLDARIEDAIAEDAADADRIAAGPALARRRLEHALSDLIEIVDTREALVSADEQDLLNQLDGALERIAREFGTDFPRVSGVEENTADPVAVRVAGAGWRRRTVTLAARWWKQPGAPLLGFRAGSGCPVALIPERSAYVLFDPVTVSTEKITPQVAASLAPRGYAIYPGLPAEATSPRALLKATLTQTRGTIGTIVMLGALAGLIAVITPIVTGLVYGSVLPQHDRSLLIAVTALLVGATVAWGLVMLSQNLALQRFSGLTEIRLDPALMDRLLQLPSDFFRRYDTGDLATRAGGLQIIRQQVSGSVLSSLLVLIFSVFSIAIMFAYSVALAALALVILIVALVVLVRLNVESVHHQREVFDQQGQIAADLFQVVQGINKVRVAGAEQRFMTRWAALYRRQAIETYASGKAQAWIVSLIGALPLILTFALYALTIAALKNSISGSHFVALMTALGDFTAGLVGVALVVGPILTTVPLWQRMRPILEQVPERQGTVHPGRLSGRIELRDVTFGYDPDDPPILANLSIDISPGEFVAITGPSGAGKSTLLRLLLGLDDPTTGTILYDGKDLTALDARRLRSQIGVVMQGARPLPGEILATIMGTAAPDESKAWEAAEAAELAEDIRLMPMGMHTLVGEGGLTFSGGQLQRMMIARALARSPNILFFDEATSALDDRTQERVSKRLELLDATRVVIAHRLSTIRRADRIYVLDQGRIVEAGTFEELISTDGLFRRLASRQLV